MNLHRPSRISSILALVFAISGFGSVCQAQTAEIDISDPVEERVTQPGTQGLEAEVNALRRLAQEASANALNVTPLASILQLGNARQIYQHLDRIYPVTNIARGSAPSALPSAPHDLRNVSIRDASNRDISLDAWQRNTLTDGLLVLHRGQVVYEHYDAGMTAAQRHATWSVSKSVTGLIATDLIQAGTIDATAPVSHYLPELRDSAWGDATIQQVLDSTTGVDYTEGELTAKSGFLKYLVASGLLRRGDGQSSPRTVADLLRTLKKKGEHGKAFTYKTVDAEVIGQLLARVTGKDYATLVSERLWAPMGAEHAGYVLKDPAGKALAGAGINSTLRDLARLGELLRQEGRFNGAQILQPGTAAEIRKGGDKQAFAAGGNGRQGYSYHNFWWVAHDADGTFEAKGFNGQHIHINPAAELVIVKLSSNVVPDTIHTHVPDRNAFAAIAKAVQGR